MSTEISVTTRHGLIVHVDGSDDSAFSKFGTAIDSGLLEQVADVQLLRLHPSHFKMKKLFGFEQSRNAKSNRWLEYLKQLREDAMAAALNDVYKSVDAEAVEFKPSAHMRREKVFKDVPDLVTVWLPDLPSGREGISVRVKKASQWNKEFQLEASGPMLKYLMNAMYSDPPMVSGLKRPRQESAPCYSSFLTSRNDSPRKAAPCCCM